MAGQRLASSQSTWRARFYVYLLASIVCVLWGSSFVLTKVALTELGPFGVAFGRWVLATAAFALYLPMRGYLPLMWQALREQWHAFALLGLVGISLFYVLQNFGLRFSTAVNVGLLINLSAVFIALLGVWWLGERMSGHALAGVTISLLGVTLITLQGGEVTFGRQTWLGDMLTILAAFAAAVYSVYGKRLVARYPPAVVTGLVAFFGTVFLFPLSWWEGWRWPLSPAVRQALGVLGIGSSALANLWWWKVLERSEAVRAGVYLLLIPIVSTFLAVALLGEPFTWLTGVGASLVLSGVALTQRTPPG